MDVRGVPRSTPERGEVVSIAEVSVGDWISEVGSPDGPWYQVLGVDERSLTIDGRVTAEEPKLPVTLGYSDTAHVLRRPR